MPRKESTGCTFKNLYSTDEHQRLPSAAERERLPGIRDATAGSVHEAGAATAEAG